MARKPRPIYTPVEPTVATLADLTPEQVWSDGALTVKQAAAFSGRSITGVRRLIRERKVPTKKDGQLRLIAKRGLVLYLATLPG
jgi:hypothetical protein